MPLLVVAVAAGAAGYLIGRDSAGSPPPDAPPACTEPGPRPAPVEISHPAAYAPPGKAEAPPESMGPVPNTAPRGDLLVGSLIKTPNGDLRVTGSAGKYLLVREGLWRTYGENGSKLSEEDYTTGVLDGPAVYYHANGNPREEGAYRAGKKHGVWTTWDEQGNRVSEGEWANGELTVPLRLWDAAGRFPPEGEALAKAEVDGKYRGLLQKIGAPDDRERYPEFHDFGHYRETDYLGHKNVPAGYWVYVYPYWYIWEERLRTDTPPEELLDTIKKHIDPIR